MKRVAIVTIESKNYGNRLQNYALQEIIKSMGIEVSTLRRGEKPKTWQKAYEICKNILKMVLQTKDAKFNAFDRKINKSKDYVSANIAPADLAKKYDCFVVGSDQVWNPYYDFVGKSDLLYFASKSQKISYAASFGVSELPKDKERTFEELLDDFSSISVREESGKKIIYNITGREVPLVLDPTLLLKAEEWRKIIKKPAIIPRKKYILVYALGGTNEAFAERVEAYKKAGYEVLDVLKRTNKGRNLPIGPAEFLYLIDNASVVLTDSFHATVFSFLFHKKVMAFARTGIDMSSRIITLGKLLNVDVTEHSEILLNIKDEYNYSNLEQNLQKERIRSIQFLKDALSD